MSKKRKPFCDLSDRQKWRLVEREMNPNTAICSRATVSVPTPNHIMEKTSPIPVDNYVIDQGCDTATWLGSASSIGEHSTGTSLPAAHSQANSVNSETFSVYVKDIETNTYDSSSGLQEDLRTWVIKYSQIPRTAVNDLLALLRRNGHCDLPNDSRTLLSTPRNSANFIETFSSGRYAHFGVYEQLKDSIVKHYPKNQYPTEVNLLINIDGLPLSKSSAIQFWPILCAILSSEFYTTPFPIGIFEGNTKPDDVNQFLKKFVDETNTILQSGIILDHKTIVVKLHAIVCDAPAKAYVCGIKNHTGYFGCPKCIQQGEFIENRVVFTETSSSERTDASFKNRIHPEHHRETTALEKLPIGMVSQVGLDYMHLVCLGVMKRLLQFWVKGKLNIRLKPNKLEEASSKLISMRAYITLEFARQPRSLNEIDRWKATEFRQFLLYTGPIVMNNILSVKTYRHFMCLSVAIRILCDVVYFEENESFSEIPSSWLNEDMKYCKWPKSLNPTALMVKGIEPSDTWGNYKVRVEKFYDTLEAARKHAGTDYTSSEEVETGRGKRKKTSVTKSTSTDDEESTKDSPPPTLKKRRSSPRFSKRENTRQSSTNNVNNNENLLSSSQEHGQNVPMASNTGSIIESNEGIVIMIMITLLETNGRIIQGADQIRPLDNSIVLDFGNSTLQELIHTCDHRHDFDNIHTNMKKIFVQIKSLESRLEQLNNQNQTNIISINTEEVQTKLPLNTLEELSTLENIVAEEGEFSHKFTSYLQTIGGKNAKDALVNMLRKVFTNKLAVSCSWHGLRGNFKLSNLKFMNRIIGVRNVSIQPPKISRSNASDNIKYLNTMVNIATVLGAKRRVAKRELNESLNFELNLSTMANQFRELRNFSLLYHRMSVSELQQKVPNIPWLEYLNSVLNVPTITIKASDVIIAAPPIYFSELEKLLLNTPKRKVFVNIVKRADWMDVETKKYALEKAEAMSSYIAYPDEFLSDETLEDFYKELHVESDNFLKIMLSTNLFGYESTAKRLALPVNQTDWVKSGQSAGVNAYYNVLSNRIILPAPILQGVFFSDDRPWYMNYGGIGLLISHEIVHGFDNKGRQFDKFGNLDDWWTPSTNEKFITKAQCIIDQYGNQSIPELGLNVNGFKTQGENIADNGGIRNAYLAYNEWIRRNGRERLLPGLNYTDRQLFWISAANIGCIKMEPAVAKMLIRIDTHSPAKFRINLPLSNTDYFAKDFNCRIGSKMNPDKKCEVWK
ncbi:hypothetical protein PPYR_00092 [Photinus pyralis]|uniref:Peptidase M13 C-terminal domain-containing protein n=1 Tax=Photinus pyralis TaxID=7054 RepID=A0A5N4B0K1_PHOPY|nr:hypothetical protein PPYR_00092 [Photinus pyralis]